MYMYMCICIHVYIPGMYRFVSCRFILNTSILKSEVGTFEDRRTYVQE